MVQRLGTPSLLSCWKNNDIEEVNNNNNNNAAATPNMQSPLPDASALEAGILEDERPSRLSRVQDNVRNLLRTSVFGSVKSSPTTPTHPPPTAARDFADDIPSPTSIRQPEVLPSPTSVNSANSPSTTHYSESPRDATTFACPQASYQQTVQRMAHQSAMFNTRAVAALNHPDLSDPSLATFSQQKMQRRQRSGWSRSPRGRKGKRAAQNAAGSKTVLCVMASLLLAALVATYISIATTTSDLSTTFHILFVLGICLATIVFAYSVIQLFFVAKRPQSPLFVAVSRHGNQRRHRHHHHNDSQRHPQDRAIPTLTNEPDFLPAMPIRVHLSSDDIRSDPLIAQPSAGADITNSTFDKDAIEIPNPPPAYGRWRDSRRADPNLLHWQAVPSPVSPATPALPSPTYEEAMAAGAQNESPPSYMTRESPERQREMRDARAGIARSQVVEPEMFEARGPGVGLAI